MNFKNLLDLIRPKHWIKNIFVFIVPLIHFQKIDSLTLINLLLVFISFCFFSSAGYVLNDWIDRIKDSFHPQKKHRPFSSGKLNFNHMLIIFFTFSSLGSITTININGNAKLVLFLYFLTTILYSTFLKNIALLDIFTISFGFVLRLFSGSISTNFEVSIELLVITFLFCLFFPLSKRKDDINNLLDHKHRTSLKGYNKKFIDTSLIICLTSCFAVFISWSVSNETAIRLGTNAIPLLLPFILLIMLRYMQFIFVMEQSGDPVRIFFRDRLLQFLICLTLIIFCLIRYLELDLNRLLVY